MPDEKPLVRTTCETCTGDGFGSLIRAGLQRYTASRKPLFADAGGVLMPLLRWSSLYRA